MRVVLVTAAVLMAALAGCFGDDKGDGQAESSSSSSSTGPRLNQTLPAKASANLTASPVNGTAPLNVTFTLSGNVTAGNLTLGNLTWTLAFGDGNSTNGTRLPQNVTHAYAAGGNFSVLLTVRAVNGTANATANLTVVVAPGAVGFAPGMDPNCQRPDAYGTDTMGWIDHRGGESVWVYEESNGIDGLQIDIRPSPIPAPIGGHQDSLALQFNCVGGDTMMF